MCSHARLSKNGQAVRRLPVWGGGAIYSHANLTVSQTAFYDNQVPSQVRSSSPL